MTLSWLKKHLNSMKICLNNDCDEAFFIDLDVQNPENLHNLHNDLPFLPERKKIGKVENLWQTYTIKKNMLYT